MKWNESKVLCHEGVDLCLGRVSGMVELPDISLDWVC